MIRISFAVLLTLAVAAEEQPRLVYDFQGVVAHGSAPQMWTTTGNTTWFSALTAPKVREIFRTDGTREGTVQVTSGQGSPHGHWGGPFIGTVNGKLIYGGNDQYVGGLYALDTSGGAAVRIADVKSEDLSNGVLLDGVLYFTARVWLHNEERLWRTDGTPEGTRPLDVLTGYSEQRLFLAGGRIFFFGRSKQGEGLHATRGTSATTTLVQQFDSWRMFWDLFHVRTVGDRLVFWFAPAPNELWATDGTPAGTKVLMDDSRFFPVGVFGDRLFFNGPGDLLWSTDGTVEGTRDTGILTGSEVRSAHHGAVRGAQLFFYVTDSSHTTLYVTEGTAATTRALLTAPKAGLTGRGVVAGGDYYFIYDDGVHGSELWRTDGTAPRLVADVNPGAASAFNNYDFIAEARPDGRLLFAGLQRDTATEPWITDGTAAGTRMVVNIAADDFTSHSGSPRNLQAIGNRVFFAATRNEGEVIGVSDGIRTTSTLTSRMEGPAVGSNGRYFFSTSAGLFATDGMSATPLHSGYPVKPYRVSGGIVFSRRVSIGGNSLGDEIVFSDGTVSGTHVIREVTQPQSSHYSVVAAGDRVWLSAGQRFFFTDGETPVEVAPAEPVKGSLFAAMRAGKLDYLAETRGSWEEVRVWRTDGTAAGTRVLMESTDTGNQFVVFIGATERRVFFAFNTQLHASDGTASGTVALPVTRRPCPSQGVLGEALIFSDGELIWRSDGTAAGTTILVTFPEDDSSCPELVTHGGRVYFDADDRRNGRELWVTDGTVAGTHLAADVEPGPEDSSPRELTSAGDRLFFTARTSIGRELWVLGPEGGKRRAMRAR